jgi:hypothetical protein
MIADTDEELYDMVDKIGVHRKWKHNDHYDICLSKRKLAVENGVVEITIKEMAYISYLKKMRKHKNIKPIPLMDDLKKIREDKNYFQVEKERIRNNENN